MGIIISKHVVYELLIAIKKGLQAKTYFMSLSISVYKRKGFVKGNRMFGNENVTKNVLILLLILVIMYSCSAFSNVLILVLMKMYSAPGLHRSRQPYAVVQFVGSNWAFLS